MLTKSIKRYIGINLEALKVPEKLNLPWLATYLISKIDDANWRTIFEACIPICKRNVDSLQVLLPYFVYYSLRYANVSDELVDVIGRYVNEVFDSDRLDEI